MIPENKRKKITADELAYLRLTMPDLTEEEAQLLAADGPRYKAIGNSMAVPVNVTRHLSFVYVEKAHQCSNELLESLSAHLWPNQASIIAGVPLSAHGAFKALWEAEKFSRFKLTAHDMADYFMPGVEQLKLQVGENSDHFRSMVLAEFPQT